jgi:hypothetical protein
MDLISKINGLTTDLLLALERAEREFERDDLPEDWNDELEDAIEAAQNAQSAIGNASDFNEHLDLIEKVLERINEHEEEAV